MWVSGAPGFIVVESWVKLGHCSLNHHSERLPQQDKSEPPHHTQRVHTVGSWPYTGYWTLGTLGYIAWYISSEYGVQLSTYIQNYNAELGKILYVGWQLCHLSFLGNGWVLGSQSLAGTWLGCLWLYSWGYQGSECYSNILLCVCLCVWLLGDGFSQCTRCS